MVVDGNEIRLPLTQKETINIKEILLELEIKLVSNGDIEYFSECQSKKTELTFDRF